MAGPGLVELIPRRCGWCHRVFTVCVGCFRGQIYCRESCRERARREQHTEANRKYQRTPHGTENHRRRQREYRERHRLGVTDQATGVPEAVSSSLSLQEPGPGHDKTLNQATRVESQSCCSEPGLLCVVCGRAGRFMEGGLSPDRWALS